VFQFRQVQQLEVNPPNARLGLAANGRIAFGNVRIIPSTAEDQCRGLGEFVGSRSVARHAFRTRANCSRAASTEPNARVNPLANRAASAGVRRTPPAPIKMGTGCCIDLGSAGGAVPPSLMNARERD
jgi:hypothetical protein